MPETDSLSKFDFNKVSKRGKFLKFEAGRPITVRILTKDPVVQERAFTNAKGEVNLGTKFCFIVWNFTDELAQILPASPRTAQTFQRIAVDDDFGANLQKCDIKISPEGEMLERTYDINVIRHSGNEKELSKKMVDEAKELDLDNDVQDNKGRLSEWEPGSKTAGYQSAKTAAKNLREEDIDLEGPINLDDIPF